MKKIFFLITLLLIIPVSYAEEKSIHDRMFYYRSVDAVVWAMPLLNFNQYRKGHEATCHDGPAEQDRYPER
jgi:hypothetical protein